MDRILIRAQTKIRHEVSLIALFGTIMRKMHHVQRAVKALF